MSADMLRVATLIRKSQDIEEQLGHIDAREYATWLAVADWLEQHATQHGSNERDECRWVDCAALGVAHAYLGTPADASLRATRDSATTGAGEGA